MKRSKGRPQRGQRSLLLWTGAIVAAAVAWGHWYSPWVQQSGKIEAFEAWFYAHGGQATNVRLAAFSDMGLGLQATAPIQEKDLVLFVPHDIVICRDVALHAVPKAMQKMLATLRSDNDLLAIFLVYERLKGVKSKWAPYLAVLPPNIPLPFLSSTDALAELHDVELAKTISASKDAVAASFDAVMRAGVAKYFRTFDAQPTLELYMWAHAVLSSRALTIRGARYLVPFADMFNGRSHGVRRAPGLGAHFLEHHKLEKDGVRVLADRTCAANDQLFEDYGDNHNYIYLLHHGFVMADNPFDCVALALPLRRLPPALEAPFRRATGLADAPAVTACFSPLGFTPSQAASLFLQLAVLDDADAARCEARLAACADPHVDAAALLQRDPVYAKWLVSAIDATIAAAPTQLEEDLALLSQRTLRHRSFVEFRASRKRLLLQLRRHLASTPAHLQAPAPAATDAADTSVAGRLASFHSWVAAFDLPPPMIQIQYSGQALGFGAFATTDIAVGDVYVALPAAMLMDSASALRCTVLGPVFRSLLAATGSRDPMHELLLHYLHERFVRREASAWAPYLALLPPETPVPTAPLFYSEDELALLAGTDFALLVASYREQVARSFDAVRRVVFTQFPEVFAADVFTRERYAHARHVLDTRSIWWDGERHLVPVLDMVNCRAGGPVHSTALETGATGMALATTRAKSAVAAGDQLFENYGQPNWIYLLYHGFVLAHNHHDCANVVLDFEPITSSRMKAKMAARLREFGVASLRAELCLMANEEVPARVLHLASLFEHVKAHGTMPSKAGDTKEAQYRALIAIATAKEQVLSAKLEATAETRQKRGVTRRNKETIRTYMETQQQLLRRCIDAAEVKLLEPLM
ncbi:hypothetical protein ACHHYP_09053 [Achlya hypogyna]|uniref:SET domain-containing protein n=1 Tax=Achlya hypogyna TaxID=1202772 RepID=A0A1V9ZJH0_ACHHY|nr:hypothetical protein ACHHYP_09053 [Achlya hypogyna]